MEFIFVAKNIELTDAIKDYARKKIGRLEKICDIIKAEIVIAVEKHRHIADVKLITKKDTIKATETSHDIYASIDLLYDNLERQIKKLKEKKSKKREENTFFESPLDTENINIVRKQISEKPITLDEAINLIQHSDDNVLAFYNSETEKVNVLYKTNDNTYTLIET